MVAQTRDRANIGTRFSAKHIFLRDGSGRKESTTNEDGESKNKSSRLAALGAALAFSILPASLVGCGVTGTNPPPPPQVLSVTASPSTPVTINVGTSETATVTPSGGTAPYTYSWTDSVTSGTCPSFQIASNSPSFTFSPTAAQANCSFVFTGQVADSLSQSKSASTAPVSVTMPTTTTNDVYVVTQENGFSSINVIVNDALSTTINPNGLAGQAITNQNTENVYFISSSGIGIINPITNTLIGSVTGLSGMQVASIKLSSDGSTLFAAGSTTSNGTIINGFVTINTSTEDVSNTLTLPTAVYPTSFTLSPNGKNGYVANGLTSTEGELINTSLPPSLIAPISVNTGGNSTFNPSSTSLFISGPDSILVTNATTGQAITTIPLPGNGGAAGGFAGAAVFTPDGTKAYVGNEDFNNVLLLLVPAPVAVVNTSTASVSTTLPEGLTPDHMGITPVADANGKYYLCVINVSSVNNNTDTQVSIDVIDTTTDTVIKTIPLATYPGVSQGINASSPVNGYTQVRFSNDGTEMYTLGSALSDTTDSQFYIIDTGTWTLKNGGKPITLQGMPGSFAPRPDTRATNSPSSASTYMRTTKPATTGSAMLSPTYTSTTDLRRKETAMIKDTDGITIFMNPDEGTVRYKHREPEPGSSSK